LAVVLALLGSTNAISLDSNKKSFEGQGIAEKEFIQQGVVLRMMNG
jgi:hypothetical protein